MEGGQLATIEEQIKSLEDEISKTKYNKATQGHIGRLKAKIASLKERKEKAVAHAKKSGSSAGFEVKNFFFFCFFLLSVWWCVFRNNTSEI